MYAHTNQQTEERLGMGEKRGVSDGDAGGRRILILSRV